MPAQRASLPLRLCMAHVSFLAKSVVACPIVTREIDVRIQRDDEPLASGARLAEAALAAPTSSGYVEVSIRRNDEARAFIRGAPGKTPQAAPACARLVEHRIGRH